MRRNRQAWWIVACLVAGGCDRERAEPGLRVVRSSPDLRSDGAPVMLNEGLTVYFSKELDPITVTPDSVSVLDGRGGLVAGTLRCGSSWLVFEPMVPLAADLMDGGFRPGETYSLQLAGYPRPDALRGKDGSRLVQAATYSFRVATLEERPPGLPAPLRPPQTEVPFVQRAPDARQFLPADAPRLRLHFTLPVLPSSVAASAFRIQLLRNLEEIVPRSVRAVCSPLDEFPGSTIEIDVGSRPLLQRGGATALTPGDFLSVTLHNGVLRDYAGSPVLHSAPQCWSVVAGSAVTLFEWPAGDGSSVGDGDDLLPGFESASGLVRPLVRVESGDGSLGVFRPKVDCVLRAGQPFDRGDGQMVVSRGAQFPFLAVDVQPGIRVRIQADGPVQILAAGGCRIAGSLEVDAPSVPLPEVRHDRSVRELVEEAPVSIVAAGRIDVGGRITAVRGLDPGRTVLTIATATAPLGLLGEVPANTCLAVDAAALAPDTLAVAGVRGQSQVVTTHFTSGVPAGAEFTARAVTPWCEMPVDRDVCTVRVLEPEAALRIGWQGAPADPFAAGAPDTRPGRVGAEQRIADLDRLQRGGTQFVRFVLTAEVAAGRPLPSLRGLRILDR